MADQEQKIELPRCWVPWLILLLMLAGIGAESLVGGVFERIKMLLWELRHSWGGPEVG